MNPTANDQNRLSPSDKKKAEQPGNEKRIDELIRNVKSKPQGRQLSDSVQNEVANLLILLDNVQITDSLVDSIERAIDYLLDESPHTILATKMRKNIEMCVCSPIARPIIGL